jgi:hypothetical protein
LPFSLSLSYFLSEFLIEREDILFLRYSRCSPSQVHLFRNVPEGKSLLSFLVKLHRFESGYLSALLPKLFSAYAFGIYCFCLRKPALTLAPARSLTRPVAFLLPKHYSCNPWRSGPSCYGWTFLLSFCSRLTSGLSGTKCLSGPGVHFPKVVLPVSEAIGPKSSVF